MNEELIQAQAECDRLNAELSEDSDIVWRVRIVFTYPDVEVPAVYKAWNE